jgi:hypothetical protein
MAKQEQAEENKSSSKSEKDETPTVQLRRSPRKHPESKQVTWKEEKLVEYANEQDKDNLDDASPSKTKTSSARHNSKNTSREKQETPAASADTLPATPSRKVRRLALPAPTNSTSSATTPKPMPVGTPIPKRKKLTPKSAGAGLLGPPAKTATSKTSSTSKSTVKGAASSVSTTTHMTSSIPKSQSLLKASSSAGATPMFKRVRTKKVA